MRNFPLIVGIWLCGIVQASPVSIKVTTGDSDEVGAGYSVSNGLDCFIVTPSHVVQGAGRNEITVVDADGRTNIANVYKEPLARDREVPVEDDAALLKVAAPVNIDCPADWTDGTAVEKAVKSAMRSEKPLTVRKETGASTRQTRWLVAEISPETLTLVPYTPRDKLGEGDSGSSVYVGDALVGIVVESKTGSEAVVVLKQRRLFALFGANLVRPTAQVALMSPVTLRNQMDPYATVALRDFLGTRTPLSVVEQAAEARSRGPAALPGPEQVPPGVDYVVIGAVLDVNASNEANPDYKPPNAQSKQSWGDEILRNMKDGLRGKNTNARYFVVYNIDVDVQVLDVKAGKTARSLERSQFKIPVSDNADRRELEKSAIQQAVNRSFEATFRKYRLPLR